MFVQNTTGRRRITRNKTVVVDPKDLQGIALDKLANPAPGDPTVALLKSFENFCVEPKPVLGKREDAADSRTYPFADLMSAFRTIEKRSIEDPRVVRDVLKRFKTNDEAVVESQVECEKERIQREVFPRIINNPFIRNDLTRSTDGIEKRS